MRKKKLKKVVFTGESINSRLFDKGETFPASLRNQHDLFSMCDLVTGPFLGLEDRPLLFFNVLIRATEDDKTNIPSIVYLQFLTGRFTWKRCSVLRCYAHRDSFRLLKSISPPVIIYGLQNHIKKEYTICLRKDWNQKKKLSKNMITLRRS